MVDTTYVHLEFESEDGVWSINLPFVCDQCGVCCKLEDFLVAGKVKITPKENPQLHAKIQAIYEEMGKRWEKDSAEYDRYIMHTPCPFLENKKCSIYPVRPDGCRQFPNTPFGFQSRDCKPLNRFKQQTAALCRGTKAKRTMHFTADVLKQPCFSEKQYQRCIEKLRKNGITEDELKLFELLNKQLKEK